MQKFRAFLIGIVACATLMIAVVGCGALTEESYASSSSVAISTSSEESFDSTAIELPEESSESEENSSIGDGSWTSRQRP